MSRLSPISALSSGHSIACASCHPEGGEDGHVWNLADGAKRTPTLRGGLMATAPFHWAGDQANIASLMSDVFVNRMGGEPQDAAHSEALLKWVDAQPALPAPSRLDPLAVQRGAALFSGSAGCASCHAGPLGTNNANASVGTGSDLQVPRLIELSYRAPYFHDGRVPTLAARFTALGGGDLHGHTSQLAPHEVDDLVAYLQSR